MKYLRRKKKIKKFGKEEKGKMQLRKVVRVGKMQIIRPRSSWFVIIGIRPIDGTIGIAKKK
jgi:hypothetical protein